MEDRTMQKKKYEKPTMEIVKLQQQCMILAGSVDAYGMNTGLQETTVDDGF